MTGLEQALEINIEQRVESPCAFDSAFAVSELALQSVSAVGCALAEMLVAANVTSVAPEATVNQRLASLWFSRSIYPVGWSLPPVWDAIAGVYPTQDGFIRLHTNLAHHRLAALRVLGVMAEKKAVSDAVSGWKGEALERQIVEAGGVAAKFRSREDWLRHPQGKTVTEAPLIAWQTLPLKTAREWNSTISEPLRGLRILDLTRVLAGPVATRMLAGLGADVLRIDPPGWDEPNIVPDITLGKRCTTLNLKDQKDRATFEELIADADVLVHGYRPGALDKLGYGQSDRQALSPGLIDVSLNAYGCEGPWSERRGFDSLVQMSCGVAWQGMQWARKREPVPLPVQALDHATGYLLAAVVLRSLTCRIRDKRICSARLSLASTAEWLWSIPTGAREGQNPVVEQSDFSGATETTPWGPAHRLRSPLKVEGVNIGWRTPATELGSASPRW